MKTLKALGLGLVAAAFAGTAAQAQTVIHITGSSAFRAPAIAAIIDYLGTGGHTVYGGYTNTSTFEPGILNANPAIFANGKLYNGTTTTGTATVIVECYFSGSAAGVVDLAVGGTATASFFDAGTSSVASSSLTGAQIDLINNGTPCTGGATVAYGGGVNITSTVTKVKENPDMAFADVSNITAAQVISTASISGPITGANGTFTTIPQIVAAMSSGTVQDLTDATNPNKFVGIVPFQWLIGNVTASGVTLPGNITQQTAKQLIGFGGVNQSLLGAPDTNSAYLLTGRNEDSGTRIVSLADSQFGALNAPFQFSITGTASGYTGFTFNSGGPGTAAGGLNTEPNIYWSADGHSGQASGATVALNLTFPENGSVTGNNGGTEADYGIGYVGTGDASYALAGGAHALTYNGVAFSIAAIQTGSYSLWNYEHAYVLSTLPQTVKTIALGISDDVFSSTADISPVNGLHAQAAGATAATVPAGILYNSAFTVSRQTEGGVISHN